MKYRRQPGMTSLVVLLLVAAIAAVSGSGAAVGAEQPTAITLAQLKGPWAASLFVNVACGGGTTYATFMLSATGSGLARIVTHTGGCDTITHDLFRITSLRPDGNGTATLGCGTGCSYNFTIQVSRNLQEFTLVDVTDSGNFLEGVAIHQ